MKRKFDIGDKVICSENGIAGTVLKFYVPTSCAEQTMVLTVGGRQYHAPTSTWDKYGDGQRIAVRSPYVDIKIKPLVFQESFIKERRGRCR